MISAIVVSHNGREHLERCLARLDRQRQEIEQVIVVDNLSTDGSPGMVRRAYPWVELLPLEENLGFGRANNRGAELARGDQLLLINSDAWLEDGAANRLARRLETDSRLGLVAPSLYYPDGKPQLSWAPQTGVWGEALQKLRNPLEARRFNHQLLPTLLGPLSGGGWFTGACLLLRRAAFQEIGGFDPEFFLYFEDVDLCLRLRQAGWRLAQAPRAKAFHVKGGSQRRGRQELEYRRSQLLYYRKHRPAWENRLLRRRLRRKFSKLPGANPADSALASQLLALLDSAS